MSPTLIFPLPRQGKGKKRGVIFPDGDTDYGNPANVRRTVQGYTAAGFAGIMIER